MTVNIVGRDHVGTIAESDGMRYYVTDCCKASAKGSIDSPTGVCCRACYQPIDAALGGIPAQPATGPTVIAAQRLLAFHSLLALYPKESQAAAVLDLAAAAGVAVFWQDRETFETSLGIKFTDEEWEKVAGELGNFDECVSNAYGVSDMVGDWMSDCVRAAGLDPLALEARTADQRLPSFQGCGCDPATGHTRPCLSAPQEGRS